MRIGFSTGSIALGDARRGLRVARHERTSAVELSALREDELDPLLESLQGMENDLKHFDYVSFHAPSKLKALSESELVAKLKRVADRDWAIVVHPDVISDYSAWNTLGRAVCIENMDKRKSMGRTASQLREIFEKLPNATFCFDIGHARQVDPTMQEAESLLFYFRNRLRQVHMSYVNSQSGHERLNFESILSFRLVAHWLDESIPIILETPVEQDDVADEIAAAERVFAFVHGGLACDRQSGDADRKSSRTRDRDILKR